MKKLYVGNIPFKAREQDLRNWFTEYGFGAENVQIIRDSFSGRSRGFAFVQIGDDEEALRAILTIDGKEFLGRPLVVNEARARARAAAVRMDRSAHAD